MNNYRKLILACFAVALFASAAPAIADVQYTYDSAGRLVRAIYSNGITISYRYDAAGNRTQIVTSTSPNTTPLATNDAAAVAALAAINIPVLANDSDADWNNLTITSVSSPVGGGSASIMGGGTYVRYTAPAGAGSKSFDYTTSDGAGGTATASVTVTVSSTNSPPVANADTAYATTGTSQAIMVLANDTDTNGHTLVVMSVSTPAGGTATVSGGGGHVIYTAPSAAGTYTFTYTIGDGNSGTATGSVSVVVTPGETPPEPCVPPPGQMFCEQPPLD